MALTEASKTNAGISEIIRHMQERHVEFLAGIYEQLNLPADTRVNSPSSRSSPKREWPSSRRQHPT